MSRRTSVILLLAATCLVLAGQPWPEPEKETIVLVRIENMITNEQIKYLAGVSYLVARIALEHTRGNLAVARDHLYNEVCRSRYLREAREEGEELI